MSEADAIAICTDGPVTRARLDRDLAALGVRPGSVLLVHCALSRLGWIPGGARTLCDALLGALGPAGTMAAPAFTTDNTDPARWENPPVPADWVETLRAELPAYDPRLSPPREMGALSAQVLMRPGVVRSAHPALSWAALGPRAAELCAVHELDCGFGERSPLGAALRLNADVLSLGCQRTTILHYAEALANYPGQTRQVQGCAMLVDGARRWTEYPMIETNCDDFEQLRLDYIQAGHPHAAGMVGYGAARRFPARELVAFAIPWLERQRGGATG